MSSNLDIGQYLQPTRKYLGVRRFVTPEQLKEYERIALDTGFLSAACAPLVKSSYHAADIKLPPPLDNTIRGPH